MKKNALDRLINSPTWWASLTVGSVFSVVVFAWKNEPLALALGLLSLAMSVTLLVVTTTVKRCRNVASWFTSESTLKARK